MVQKMASIPPVLLTQQEVAQLLKVNVRTIQQWTKDGRMPRPMRLGSRPRYNAIEITEWLNEQGEGK